jgi:cell shape-determining protein MreC
MTLAYELLVDPSDFPTREDFEKAAGTGYRSIAYLFHTVSNHIGVLEKTVRQEQRLIERNKSLEKENRELRYKNLKLSAQNSRMILKQSLLPGV